MKSATCIVLAGLLTSACGGSSSSPTSPSMVTTPSSSSMTGTWTGTSMDSTGQAKDVWTVSQVGTGLTGTMKMSDDTRSMMGNGTMRGTVNGRAFSFHIEMPSGSFTGMMAACSMVMDGDGMMSDDGHTMTGTYSGTLAGMMGMMGSSQSCGGAMSNGTFTATR